MLSMSRLWLIFGCALAVSVSACRDDVSARIRGWPLTAADRALMGKDVVEEADEPVVAPSLEPSDVVSEVTPIDPARPGPCAQLVNFVCELYGTFNDGCQEARAKSPDDSHPQTREGCEALLMRFTEEELPRVGGSCYRFTRALCAVYGDGSERCKTARATIQLARSRREHRICLGDWLILESRDLRR